MYQHTNSMKIDLDSYIEKDDITVIIPVLNEEEGIGKVITDVRFEGYKNILVVDGYSTDSTFDMAKKSGVNVILQEGKGKTGAIRTAINNVKTKYLLIMDGDCTYHPRDIKNFFPFLDEHQETIGIRVLGRDNIPLLNRFGNLIINILFNSFFRTNLIDVCSGMYALKTEFAKSLLLHSKGFDVEVEIAAQAACRGKVAQVPINYYQRVGTQKLNPLKHGPQIIYKIFHMGILSKSTYTND